MIPMQEEIATMPLEGLSKLFPEDFDVRIGQFYQSQMAALETYQHWLSVSNRLVDGTRDQSSQWHAMALILIGLAPQRDCTDSDCEDCTKASRKFQSLSDHFRKVSLRLQKHVGLFLLYKQCH
jgi:hypothetical protein